LKELKSGARDFNSSLVNALGAHCTRSANLSDGAPGGTAIALFQVNAGLHHRERPPNDPVGPQMFWGGVDREPKRFHSAHMEKDWGFFSGEFF